MCILGAIKTGQIDLGIGAGYVHTFHISQTGPYSAFYGQTRTIVLSYI